VYVDVDTGRGFQKARVMSSYSVGYIVGSLSTESINRRLAKALIHLSPKHLKFVEIPIGDLPLYNRDFDTDYPPAGRALKDAIAAVDAVLFVTPEYNRGIPGCLKNAIDWASRPHGTNSFTRKPSAMIGASPGKIGTAVGQQSLRSALSFCDSPLMGAPEAYLQLTPGLITEVGEVTDKGTEQFLRDFMEAFEVFVARVLTVVTPERLGATG
jgi:chromate reductase, NAD(P)H dehydrogenase (quinone)